MAGWNLRLLLIKPGTKVMEEKLLPPQMWGVAMLSKNTLKTVRYQIGSQAFSTPILQDP